jgi:hypothetical protein
MTCVPAGAPNQILVISRIRQNSARRLRGDLITARQVLDRTPTEPRLAIAMRGFLLLFSLINRQEVIMTRKGTEFSTETMSKRRRGF